MDLPPGPVRRPGVRLDRQASIQGQAGDPVILVHVQVARRPRDGELPPVGANELTLLGRSIFTCFGNLDLVPGLLFIRNQLAPDMLEFPNLDTEDIWRDKADVPDDRRVALVPRQILACELRCDVRLERRLCRGE